MQPDETFYLTAAAFAIFMLCIIVFPIWHFAKNDTKGWKILLWLLLVVVAGGAGFVLLFFGFILVGMKHA